LQREPIGRVRVAGLRREVDVVVPLVLDGQVGLPPEDVGGGVGLDALHRVALGAPDAHAVGLVGPGRQEATDDLPVLQRAHAHRRAEVAAVVDAAVAPQPAGAVAPGLGGDAGED
ncbi:MAG: hypothetical protein ACK56I_15180, partial [bacterium]